MCILLTVLTKCRMGLTSLDDPIDHRAMDTAEEVMTKIVKHDMYYPGPLAMPVISKTGRKRSLPRHQWRFKAEFSDGNSTVATFRVKFD